MDADESTTVLARTLKAFQMPASQAGKVVDALAAGELKSTVTMTEIAQGMTYASASAHQMGLDVTDTTTALAILNDAGVAGTKAGTSLNQMFVRISNPTKKAREGLQELHLWTKRGTSAFFDQQGEFVGFRRGDRPADQLVGRADPAAPDSAHVPDLRPRRSARRRPRADARHRLLGQLPRRDRQDRDGAEVRQRAHEGLEGRDRGAAQLLADVPDRLRRRARADARPDPASSSPASSTCSRATRSPSRPSPRRSFSWRRRSGRWRPRPRSAAR